MSGERRKASLAQIFKGNNVFSINLVCPDNTSINRSHSIRDNIQTVLQESCKQLGIASADIFGIAVHEYNEYRFISMKKTLHKFLPSEAIVDTEQLPNVKKTPDTKEFSINNTMKTCRLYLRVKKFLINVDVLNGRTLYYYFEQTRLDALRYQNWLQLLGLTEIFHNIAATSIWLKYGETWVDVFKQKKVPLHFYLPMCEQTETTWSILQQKLTSLNEEYGFTYDCESTTTKLPLSKTDSTQSAEIRVGTVTTDDVMIVDEKETIMLTLVKETLKLPFYGVHFYHVSQRQDEGNHLTNCKLGVGPFGVMVVVSPFYTTWKESLRISWASVGSMNYEKNILNIMETRRKPNESEPHQFVCLNEKEAKYLFTQLKDNHTFQLQMHERRIESKTKRNSIGVLKQKKEDEKKLSVTPIPRRTLSFSLLLFPRKFSN